MASKSHKQKLDSQEDFRKRVQQARMEPIASGMFRAAERLNGGAWLDPESPLAADADAFLKEASDADLLERKSDLEEYAAASALLHCADAWNYLGRAITALCAGVTGEAVHLVYYSEIRSTLSLLSGSGLLTTGQASVALSNGDPIKVTTGSTHDLVWRLLNEWSATPETAALIGGLIRYEGQPLTRWLDAANVSSTATVASLLQLWGMDLENFKSDRDRRNVSSYRPRNLTLESLSGFSAWVRDVTVDVASLVEPRSSGTFPALDRLLVWQALSPAIADLGAKTDKNRQRRNARIITGRLYGSDYEATRVATSVLGNFGEGQPGVVAAASHPTPVGDAPSREALSGMVGRALVLARLATGTLVRVVRTSGLPGGALDPWMDQIGLAQGYWKLTDRPAELIELWEDIAMGIDDLSSLSISDSDGTIHIQREQPLATKFASGITRNLLWNLSA